jgi:hypothetical protein
LLSDSASAEIAAALAPYLIAHPTVEMVFDGIAIRPQDNVAHEQRYELTFEHAGETHEASLRVIEWRSGSHRSLHLCDGEGVPVDDLPGPTAPDFTYSAYVL